MAEARAYEVMHGGDVYRAADRDVLLRWAREHRISREDSFRKAGTEDWLPVTGDRELDGILDPESWWTVSMGGETYVASDWDTVVRWTREGRLTSDVRIEGPKTPPGGIMGNASPELAPYLREPEPPEPDVVPPRLRFDGRTWLPGDLETLAEWIGESRVPREAEVSIEGGEWVNVTECGHFPPELWPDDSDPAGLEPEEPVEPAGRVPEETGEMPPEEAAPPPSEERPEQEAPEGEETSRDEAPHPGEEPEPETEPEETLYRVTTTYGEDYVFSRPSEVRSLLRRKKVHIFDEVRHPELPDGSMFIGDFLKRSGARSGPNWVLLVVSLLLAAAGVLLLVLKGTAESGQLMMVGGIASLAVAAVLMVGSLRRG